MNNPIYLSQASLQATIDRNPLMVTPDTTVMATITAMGKTGASCVLVVTDSEGQAKKGRLVGILTARDLVGIYTQPTPLEKLPIQTVMSQPVITLPESALTDIGVALTLLQNHGIRYLPLLDNSDRVVGLIEQGILTEILAQHVLQLAANHLASSEQPQSAQALQQLNQELEQRVAERTADLQASEERWQLVLKGANDGVFDWDLKSNKIFYSSRWKQMRGFAEDEIGDSADECLGRIHPDDYDRVMAAADEHFAGKTEFFELEYRTKRKDGSYMWVLDRAQALRDEFGQAVRVSGSETDITDRKHLEEARNRLLTILEASTDYIRVKDAKHNQIWRNAAFRRLQGIDREPEPSSQQVPIDYTNWAMAVLQQQELPAEIAIDHPDWVMTLLEQQAIPAVIAQGSWVGETVLLDAAGQEIPVSHLLLVHKSPQGEVQFFSSIMRDIRDRKEYEQRLELSNDELLRANRLKDEFLATMSHELRTPLNAVLGLAESLQEEILGAMNERQKKAIATIERSGQHLLNLINDILDVSKIEAGKLELKMTAVAVTDLCNSSLAFVKQQAFKKQIQLTTTLAPNLGNIDVDERRLRQVLINLLNNSVKFTPAGGRVTLAVRLEDAALNPSGKNPDRQNLEVADRSILLSITDTGIGISPENQAKLFQPFVQIDSGLNRQYEGTGLGLTLVKKIVELHGGSVSLTSELGQGSCFTVRLPYRYLDEKQTTSHGETTNTEPIAEPTQVKRPLILLAEDNQENIDTFSSYLEARNYRLILAKNGQEAIDLAQAHSPDLILMDIQMPGVNGLEAMQIIRQDSQLAQIPIIALTALAMEGNFSKGTLGDREKCLAAGANDYLAKPIKLKQLTAMIQQYLAAKEVSN